MFIKGKLYNTRLAVLNEMPVQNEFIKKLQSDTKALTSMEMFTSKLQISLIPNAHVSLIATADRNEDVNAYKWHRKPSKKKSSRIAKGPVSYPS